MVASRENVKKSVSTAGSVAANLIESAPSERSKIVMRRFASACLAKGIDALLQEFSDLKNVCPTVDQLKHPSFDKNPDKNRYKDIICIEDTRVKLIWPVGSTQDYIHGNWVKNIVPEMDKQLICTQGPMENTIDDFWRMVWQEKISAIIMLCSVVEGGKKKCEQYWPANNGQSITASSLTITNIGVEKIGNALQYTKLKILGPNSKVHMVNHCLWSGWPDKHVPLTSTGALRLIFRTQTFSPAIVHCSAGVGRTGTIVALEICMRILNAGNELSVYNVIKDLRSRRYLCCQTDLQYLYIHRSILAFITSKNILSSEGVSNFVADYENLVKARAQAD